ESRPQRRIPMSYTSKLISESNSRREISISGCIERSAARRQGNRRWIIQSSHGKRIVGGMLALERRINLPPQAIGHGQSGRDLPGVLAVERKVLCEQRVRLKCGWLGER